MLVLTRKLMEKLYIGTDVCVTVVRLEGGQVRLGIDAPRDVPVVRAELLAPRDEAREVEASSAPAAAPMAPFMTRSASAPGIGIRRRGPSR
ncbi:carbon storage regulator [Tundrisphaera sp. TA3]|uniref:carbon storage regulator n=1 Tax=Tundrisphaera sp. TA3 TaxID=3435775 RepID=UPI003EBBB14A